jgi:hypothetical protein
MMANFMNKFGTRRGCLVWGIMCVWGMRWWWINPFHSSNQTKIWVEQNRSPHPTNQTPPKTTAEKIQELWLYLLWHLTAASIE